MRCSIFNMHTLHFAYDEPEHALKKNKKNPVTSLQTKTLCWKLQKSHQWLDMLLLHAVVCYLNLNNNSHINSNT